MAGEMEREGTEGATPFPLMFTITLTPPMAFTVMMPVSPDSVEGVNVAVMVQEPPAGIGRLFAQVPAPVLEKSAEFVPVKVK
jgi:hypothetical protein